jgi:hypothetical protein
MTLGRSPNRIFFVSRGTSPKGKYLSGGCEKRQKEWLR